MNLSADGRILASTGFDGVVRIWDIRNGIQLRKIRTGGDIALQLSLSANGKRVAFYAPDGTPEGLAIRIVDLDKPVAPRIVSPQYGAFSLSHDGKKLAIVVGNVMVFDADTGAKLLDVPLGMKSVMALDVAFDEKDGRIAVTAPSATVTSQYLSAPGSAETIVVDAVKGTILHRLSTNFSENGDVPSKVLFSRDGVLVRSTRGDITHHGLTAGATPVKLPGRYRDMAIAGDRLWVSHENRGNLPPNAPTNKSVAMFTLPNLTPVQASAANAPMADLIATSSDGSTVVFAVNNRKNELDTFMDIRDGQTMRPLRSIEGTDMTIKSAAFNPTADQLITGGSFGDLGRWNLRDGTRQMPLPDEERDHGPILDLAYTPNGSTFISTNGTWEVRARDTATGRTVRRWITKSGYFLKYAGFIPKSADLITVALDTKHLVKPKKKPTDAPQIEEKYDLLIDRWDLSGPNPPFPATPIGNFGTPPGKRIGQTTFEAKHVSMSPTGEHLAIAGNSTLALVHVATGKVVWVAPLQTIEPTTAKQRDGALDNHARFTTFSPDGKSVVLSTRRLETKKKVQVYVSTLFVFDAANGRIKSTHALDTYGPLAWHHDKLFIAGLRPTILDTPKMTVRAHVEILDNNVTSVNVHPKRQLFVVGGDGGATSFVDDDGKTLTTVVSTPNGEWIAAAQDGTYRSSLDGARALAWNFASPLEGFSFERFAARFDKPEVLSTRLAGQDAPTNVELARPPRLTVNDGPQGILQTSERSVSIATTATSGSRVDRVRAFVDGRPVAEQLVCAREGKATLTVSLHAGQNRVGLVAYDAAGQASNTQNIDVVSTSPLAQRPNLHVVAIGVSRYPNMTPDQQLEYADDDARSVAEAFRSQVGDGKPFAKMSTTLLLDSQVTVRSVEEAVATLRSMGPDDLGVVFFAGHGAKLAEGKMVFMTHQAAFTRTSAETYGVGWDKIHASLAAVRGRVLMMLDACHSGYLTTEVVAPNEELARQLTAGNRAGVFIFSAARGSQFSYEVPPQGMGSSSRGLELAWTDEQKPTQKPPPMTRELPGGHGLFTSALLEALKGDSPDRDRSGATEVGELVDYVTERVRAASNGKQTPWVARREMFGEFFVVPARK